MRFAVLTISDRSSRGEREDRSGPEIVRFVQTHGWTVAQTKTISDAQQDIENLLIEWSDSEQFDVILTTGGTGFSSRDTAPEATIAVIEKLAPGLVEAIRAESLKITPHAMLSRAAAGIRGGTLIINLPGNPKAVVESLHVIAEVLPHAVALLKNAGDAESGHEAHNSEAHA